MSIKLATKTELFTALGIQTDQEARTHLCAILAVFLAEEGITAPTEHTDTARFRETLRQDLCNPRTSRLGQQVEPLFRQNSHKCIETLFQLACHVKRHPLFYRRLDIAPVLLFPRAAVNGVPDSDLRVHRAAWPVRPMFGFRLRDLLLRPDPARRVMSADEKWVDGSCLDFDLLVKSLAARHCHRFDPAGEDILWSKEDPSFFQEAHHAARLPGEEVVTRENFHEVVENAIAGCHEVMPRWPMQIFTRCRIYFVIRPHAQVRGSGMCFVGRLGSRLILDSAFDPACG